MSIAKPYKPVIHLVHLLIKLIFGYHKSNGAVPPNVQSSGTRDQMM
jgi:hypothetical protein